MDAVIKHVRMSKFERLQTNTVAEVVLSFADEKRFCVRVLFG